MCIASSKLELAGCMRHDGNRACCSSCRGNSLTICFAASMSENWTTIREPSQLLVSLSAPVCICVIFELAGSCHLSIKHCMTCSTVPTDVSSGPQMSSMSLLVNFPDCRSLTTTTSK
eukprot:3418353-Rhodomonas_salina.1